MFSWLIKVKAVDRLITCSKINTFRKNETNKAINWVIDYYSDSFGDYNVY